MKIEKLRKNHKNKIIIGGVITLGVIGAITILPSFAKYKVTQDINIVNGTINYKVPDFQTIAMYQENESGDYEETTTMPNNGYIINDEKSYCNLNGTKDNEAILKTIDGNHTIAKLIKGDKCYLYFDKYNPPITIPDIIAANNPKDTTPDFSKTATANEGVYKESDGMYSGDSYYWRGAVENNYVKFAGFCWRIIRINGDGSIRLIYDGTTCHENGKSTAESIAKTNQTYNAAYNRSEYVGYTYTQGSQRGNASASNLKTQTEEWYATNIVDKGYDEQVVLGKFCNDRNTASEYSWDSQPNSIFYYATRERLVSAKTPALSCTNASDIYLLKAGVLTADEVAFAGGVFGISNSNYYLYNGQYYWTISPCYWMYNGPNSRYSGVFIMYGDGQLAWSSVNNAYGIRPVINLTSDTQFKAGTDGTLNNPYEVI